MKVACISYFAPGKENNQGPNSLLYQLIANRSDDISIDIYLPEKIFNELRDNKHPLERELNVNIYPLEVRKASLVRRLCSTWWPRGAKIHAVIDDSLIDSYDLVWGYPYWTAPNLRRLSRKVLISGMDSTTLLYFRKVKACLKDRSWTIMKYLPALIRTTLFEMWYLRSRWVHVVGRADDDMMKLIGVDSFYVPHPINPIKVSDLNCEQVKSKSIVRILVSNALDSFYGSKSVLEWIRVLLDETSKFNDKNFEIIFHKGNHIEIAKCLSGEQKSDCVSISFVGWIDNYEEFLTGIDIQLFPLDVGAGTKTSVLTALYMNVTCIGTPIACENIVTRSSTDSLLVACSPIEFGEQFVKAVINLDNLTLHPEGFFLGPVHSPPQSVGNFWNKVVQKYD